LPEDVIQALIEKGYRPEPHAWKFGNLQVIQRQGDRILAASDPRGRGVSRVFEH